MTIVNNVRRSWVFRDLALATSPDAAIVLLGLLLWPGFASPIQAQERDRRIDDLRSRAVAIRTIDPADDDYSDLAALAAAIGDARIVQLGESTHGDGAAFAAKVRLVKYLHRELGFDVLLWESGMYDVRVVNDSLRSAADPLISARLGVFGIWSRTREVSSLFRYARDSHRGRRPLEMAGFDMQFSGRRIGDLELDVLRFIDGIEHVAVRDTAKRLTRALMDGYRRIDELAHEQGEYLLELRRIGLSNAAIGDSLRAWRETREQDLAPSQPDLDRFLEAASALLEFLQLHRSEFASSRGELEAAFVTRILGNLREYGISQYERNFAGRPADGPGSMALSNRGWNRRDTRMADNMRWLSEVMYPDRKLIVWAHNGHIMNAYYSADWSVLSHQPVDAGMTPMGVFIAERFANAVYTIGFTAFEGEFGIVGAPSLHQIETMPAASLEALLHELRYDQAFVDFRALPPDHWLRQRATMTIRGYMPEVMDDWTRVVDGIVFINRMVSATPIRQP